MPFQPRPTRRFKRGYRGKSAEHMRLVDNTLELLLRDPRHPGLNTHRIQGREGVWECYTNRALRITFEYRDENGERVIVLRNTCNHDDVLRKP